ncbi:hypothetical protein P7K49_002409 [Saguinus oedipus]|uniref:Uncharacterized protein n=1 Tax=Saguinus oedipus TaxID=9490 RepID=A0ABQ9WHA1_SAGOE|nr:hypothetical protein P7K49_002409 [Saguinus oedipus]
MHKEMGRQRRSSAPWPGSLMDVEGKGGWGRDSVCTGPQGSKPVVASAQRVAMGHGGRGERRARERQAEPTVLGPGCQARTLTFTKDQGSQQGLQASRGLVNCEFFIPNLNPPNSFFTSGRRDFNVNRCVSPRHHLCASRQSFKPYWGLQGPVWPH